MKLDKWYELRDKTAALSLRERAILMVVGIVLVAFIWAQFYFLNFEKELKKTNQSMAQIQKETLVQSEQLAKLTNVLANDPNKILLDEQAQLQSQLDGLKDEIELRLSHLIPPERMADVMREVLSDYKGLRLLAARNLPVEPLKLSAQKEDKENQDDAGAALFSHRFEMILSGDYFQTLAFLKRLEEMQGFYWTMLKYEVEDYPKAKITLELSTLSLDEDWIGV